MQTIRIRHHGRTIVGDLDFPKGARGRVPAVLLVHGSWADRNYLWFPRLRNRLLAKGAAVMAIDLNGHGQSGGASERFTWTKAVQDVAASFNYLQRHPRVKPYAIAGIGHSLGGVLLLIAQAKGSRFTTLILVAPNADSQWHLKRDFPAKLVRLWRKEGKLSWYHKPLGRTLTLNYGYYRDHQLYDTLRLVPNIHQPVLIIHGSDDRRVPLVESQRLFRKLHEPKKLIVVPHARHRFSTPGEQQELFALMFPWLRNYTIERSAHSVVAVVRFKGKILALKRSQLVGYYRGVWAVIGGHLLKGVDPVKHALVEAQEECGFKRSQLRVVRVGKRLKVNDTLIGRVWFSTPVLLEATTDRVQLDWEHTAFRWVKVVDFPFAQSYTGIRQQFASLGLL